MVGQDNRYGMKRLYILISSLFGWLNVIAQSVYMHEAQHDAEESGATGFTGIFSVIVFFGVIYFISRIWPSKNDKSSNISNKPYGTEEDYDSHWEEDRAQEQAEMEMSDYLEDTDNNISSYNSLDFSPIKSTGSDAIVEQPIKPKYHPSTGDTFFDKIVCEEEEKYYPAGSIEDKLKGLTKDGFVDLGLSVKWSSKNIGATEIYELGLYFRWGCLDYIDSFDREKILEYSKIPYPKEIENIEENICGNPQYDMATKLSNGAERLPTKEEFEELINKCKWVYLEVDKYKGFVITGPSGNSIYLPMAYHSFVNCMYQMMMSVGEAYMSGVPNLKNEYGFEEKSAFFLGVNNKNHKTEDFEVRVDSYFKARFSPVRSVLINK